MLLSEKRLVITILPLSLSFVGVLTAVNPSSLAILVEYIAILPVVDQHTI
jgi:hypothetical protein